MMSGYLNNIIPCALLDAITKILTVNLIIFISLEINSILILIDLGYITYLYSLYFFIYVFIFYSLIFGLTHMLKSSKIIYGTSIYFSFIKTDVLWFLLIFGE
jgi:hypothetical protein